MLPKREKCLSMAPSHHILERVGQFHSSPNSQWCQNPRWQIAKIVHAPHVPQYDTSFRWLGGSRGRLCTQRNLGARGWLWAATSPELRWLLWRRFLLRWVISLTQIPLEYERYLTPAQHIDTQWPPESPSLKQKVWWKFATHIRDIEACGNECQKRDSRFIAALKMKIAHIHSSKPLVLLALEMSILANAKKCLCPKRSFISLLDAVAEPPASSSASFIWKLKQPQTSMVGEIDQFSSRAFCTALAYSLKCVC